jgi:hypothetical protein
MPSIVKLRNEHLNKIIDITEDIILYKSQYLKPQSWATFETMYLPSLIQQIRDNEWRINHPGINTFKWLQDQIRHCRKLAPGVNPKHALHLDETRTGREVIAICEAASKGQIYYDGFTRNSTFNNLFV